MCDNHEKLEMLFKNIFGTLKPNGKTLIIVPSTPPTIKDQEIRASLGMLVPLRNEAKGKDPFFAYSQVFSINPADGARTPLFRLPNYFWSEKKLKENLENIGFVNVKRLLPEWSKYQPPAIAAKLAALEEAPSIIVVAEKAI